MTLGCSQEEPKNFMSKDATTEELIRGCLDCMPMGAKTCTMLPAEAVQALANGGVRLVGRTCSGGLTGGGDLRNRVLI